jgi:TPR repeat protein
MRRAIATAVVVAFLISGGCETSTATKNEPDYLAMARAEIENYRVPDQKEFYGFVLGDELRGRENHHDTPDEETGGLRYTLPDPQGIFDFARIQTDRRGVVLRLQFFKTFTSGPASSDFFGAVVEKLKATYPVYDHSGSTIWIRASESDDDWLREYSEYLRRKDEWVSPPSPFFYILHPTLALVDCGMFQRQVGGYGVALEFTSKEYYRARESHKKELQQRLEGPPRIGPEPPAHQGPPSKGDREEGLPTFDTDTSRNGRDQSTSQNSGARLPAQEVVIWCKTRAAQGDPEAQFDVAEMYRLGVFVSQDFTEAVKWYRKAADQGHAASQDHLGDMYRLGNGVSQNDEEAVEWYRRAAKQGQPDAQYFLGASYLLGRGVPKDYKEAVKWFRRAADQGNADALFALGAWYSSGTDIPPDYREAAKWYTLAAEQGHLEAQLLTGICHALGKGVLEDYVEAYKWFMLAATNGHKDAEGMRQSLRKKMTPAQVEESQRRAKEFTAAHQGRLESNEALRAITLTTATGCFVTPAGYLLTARHAVEKAARVEVVHVKQTYPAKVILRDESTDVAVLKVEGTEFPCLPLASSAAAKTGDSVFTVGFPQIQVQGTEAKFTEGSISALSGLGDSPRFFQISVPVQPGNSGGPLVNEKGEVVGLIVSRLDDVAALMATGAVPQTVNYALKSSFILPLIESVPGLADKLPKGPAAKDRSAAIENARKAVVLIVGYKDDDDSKGSSPP